MKLFVVCGPESSGNRMLAAAFVRAGCWGEGSTNQPRRASEIPKRGPAVIIVHFVENLLVEAMELGWRPELLLVVRDPVAQSRSAVMRRHFGSVVEALQVREHTYHTNMKFAWRYGLPIHMLPYEGLTDEFFHEWLPQLGLTGDVSGSLIVQDGRERFINQNGKHYADHV